jgi:hypothetical protein
MKLRFLLLLAVLLGCSAFVGCEQRLDGNPFVGPNGSDGPFGKAAPAPTPTAPHRG